jgi:hypothetical protein
MNKQEMTALLAAFTKLTKQDRVFLLQLACRLKQKRQESITGSEKGGA